MLEKINVQFQIFNTSDPKKLIVVDTSTWSHIKEKPSIVEIIPPGFSSPVTHVFAKEQVNVFNSILLGLNCSDCELKEEDLPDGVYTITVKGSPDKFQFERSYLRTELIRLELDKLFINLNLNDQSEFNKQLFEKINQIDLYIRAAEANVRWDNVGEAQELLFKAQKELKKLKGCNTCI